MQCKAKSKQSGERCKRYATPGREVCATHGGKSLGGLASPTYKHGRYSTYLPTRMAARYQEAQSDPAMLELRADVALLDARLSDVLTRVDTGESGRLWSELHQWNTELTAARRANDAVEIAAALTMIQRLIAEGHADWAAWQDIRSLIEQRRKLVESERKANATMTAEQFMLLAGALVAVFRDSVQRNVSDDKERRRALADASAGVERLISDRHQGGAES